MKTSWTCYAGTQSFDVVTTTHMESGWELGFFLFVCFRDGLVVRLRCLSGKIVVVHIISMQDIYHNFLCNRWFSRLAKFLDCKDCYFPYYLSFLTLGQRFSCNQLHLSISSHHPINMITESVYPINPPNLQGEKRVLRDQSGM